MSRPIGPMRPLLWKSVIELTPYALLQLAAYAMMFFIDLRAEPIGNRVEPAERFLWFGLLTAAFGGLVGYVQIARETRPDTRGFSLHRPVSNIGVFLAKVIAGQVMLLVLAGLSYTAAMWWLSVPGNAAIPFYWSMAIPGVGSLVMGLIGHAAGLLLAANRRLIPRALALLGATAGVGAVAAVELFPVAMLVGALFIGALLWGAHAAFVAGDGDTASFPAQLARAVALVPGAMGVYWVSTLVIGSMATGGVIPSIPKPETEAFVTWDGRIVKAAIRDTARPSGVKESYPRLVTDLDGKRLADVDSMYMTNQIGAGVMQTLRPDFPQLTTHQTQRGYRDPSLVVRRAFSALEGPIWYFERPNRIISVYDEGTKRRVGWISPEGYSDSAAMPTRRFSGDFITEVGGAFEQFMLFTDAVYSVEYPKMPRLLYQAPAGDTIVRIATSYYNSQVQGRYEQKGTPSFYAVISTTGVTLVDRSGQVVLRTRHPEWVDDSTYVAVYRAVVQPGVPTFIWYSVGDSLNRVLEYRGSDSVAVSQQEFAGTRFEPRVHSRGVQRVVAEAASKAGVNPVTPLAGRLVEAAEGRVPARELLWNVVYALLAMVTAVVIGRRYALSAGAIAAWAGATALGGILVVLIVWLTMNRTAQERCSSCGRKRPVDRERCEGCNAPFAEPEMDGTEILTLTPKVAL